MLRGLEKKPKLNGREVKLVAFHADRGRWEVELEGAMPMVDLFKIEWHDDWWEPFDDDKYSSLRKEPGVTFKELLMQKLERLKLTDGQALSVVDCNGRAVSVFDGRGVLLTELSGKHLPRKVETESEVCQRSFPLQFQKKSPEGRTLAIRPSSLHVREDDDIERLRKRKVEMSVGAVHAKPELDGQYGLLGAFQGSSRRWEVMPDARGLWDIQADGTAAPVKLRSQELCDEATGATLQDPVQVEDWKLKGGEKAVVAKVAFTKGQVIMEDEPSMTAAFSLDMGKLMQGLKGLSPSMQEAVLQLSQGPDSLPSLRSENSQPFNKDTLLAASAEFGQLSDGLQDQIWGMMRIFDANCFFHSRSSSKLLYLALARVNHSCRPNAVLGDPKLAERDPKLHSKLQPFDPLKKALVAAEDIGEGEEITVNYLSADELLEPRQLRREKLWERFGFECCCTRCLDEEADAALRVFRCEGSSDASGREVGLDVKAAEEMHVASFMDLWKTLPRDGLVSPDPLVAIAEMASEHLAPTHWLLCKVRYVLSCFYEKSQRPALAVENLQGILELEQRILGCNSPGKLEQKGDQLMMKGDLPQAFDCYAQVLKVLKTHSPDPPGSSPQCEEMRRKLRSVLDAAKTDGYPGKA